MTSELPEALSATNRFEVRKVLGRGSFGTVFAAFDREAGTEVALKWLKNYESHTLARFKREFRSLADLRHPNLVRYRDLLMVGGQWFFTMDLVVGVDLVEYLRAGPSSVIFPPTITTTEEGIPSTIELGHAEAAPSSRPVRIHMRRAACFSDLERVRSVFDQLAAGLSALHAASLIHRDLKPSNVLVTDEGRVVILDLGLVTELGEDGVDMSRSGVIVGTPAYMSPEQAFGARLTPAADWYAVGTMLYLALTGRLPFEGPPHGLLVKKQIETPPSPTELARGVPEDLAQLCLELIARAPEMRPSGVELRRRLTAAAESARERSPTPTSFVGRDAELDALRAAFDPANERLGVLLVSGDPGIGKTTLVKTFLDQVRRENPGALVFEGRCNEREAVPYKAFDAIVDAVARWLGHLPERELTALLPGDVEILAAVFPVVTARLPLPPPSVARRTPERAFAVLRELLGRIADKYALILFADDLQWADDDSVALAKSLFAEPNAPRLFFVGTWEGTPSHLVTALGERAPTIALGPLDAPAARDLVRSLLGSSANDDRITALVRESGGSPLRLRELVVKELAAR